MSDSSGHINLSAVALSQFAQQRVASQAAISVMAKAQHIQKDQGQAMVELIQSAGEIQQQSLAQARQGHGLDITA